jgi:ribose 5-phosphate isomerase B
MKVYFGADHRGFELKAKVKQWLDDRQIPNEDMGAFEYDPEDDFNDSAIAVAKAMQQDSNSRGILLCGSSYGVCIQANRFKGIRAISGFRTDLVKHARTNDDANVLCLDADTIGEDYGEIIEVFLDTEFNAIEKYVRRSKKLDEVET